MYSSYQPNDYKLLHKNYVQQYINNNLSSYITDTISAPSFALVKVGRPILKLGKIFVFEQF